MDIQTQSPVSGTSSGSGPIEAEATATNSALASDFETFLKMLTTQMENQDPLNPLEASDFAVQLATFSGVEQQIRTNDLLASLVSGSGGTSLGELANWVGMEVRVSGAAQFSGTPISLAPEPDVDADSAFLIVKDPSGSIVSREELPIEGGPIFWGGVGPNGSPLGNGKYSFEVESRKLGEVLSTKSVDHYALVREAQTTAQGGILLALSGGQEVNAEDVSALRLPTGPA